MKGKRCKKSNWKYKKMVKNSLITIISVFILTIILQSIVIRLDKEYVPSIFGYTYLNVLTNSMKPEFQKMDAIVGRKITSIDKLKAGDVLTYREGSQLISHRIKEINEVNGQKVIITKGDANPVEDRLQITENDLISKYSFKIPYAGYVIAKIQNFKFLLLVWIIAMYYIVKNIVLEIRKNRKCKLQNQDKSIISKEMEA